MAEQMRADRRWTVSTDMFGGTHVYDEGGDRLTNDRMSGTEGWEDIARLIASAPLLLEALEMAERTLAVWPASYEHELPVIRAALTAAKPDKQE